MTAPRRSAEDLARKCYVDSMWSSPDTSVCSCHCHGPSEANVEHHIAAIARHAHEWAALVLKEADDFANTPGKSSLVCLHNRVHELIARERAAAEGKEPA